MALVPLADNLDSTSQLPTTAGAARLVHRIAWRMEPHRHSRLICPLLSDPKSLLFGSCKGLEVGKRHNPEEIIGKLREAEIVLAQGGTTGDACRRIAIAEQTFGSRHAPGMAALPQYRWRTEHGGLKTDQAQRMKDLEKENGRLRRAISDLTLDKLILQDKGVSNRSWGSIVARMPGETSEPRAATALHRSCLAVAAGV